MDRGATVRGVTKSQTEQLSLSFNEWEIIPTILGKGWGFSRNWATAHFLAFDDWPRNYHGTAGCVI